MSLSIILTQIAITLVVVAVYHLWVSSKKQAAPETKVVAAPVVQVSSAVAAPVVPPPNVSPPLETMPPEILAIIAAAIAVVLDRPHRVVSVQPAAELAPEVNVWALEGRMKQFMSHKVR